MSQNFGFRPPGSDTIEKLIDEIIEPTEIKDMVPIDLGGIRDSGMQALVALASACKWNILRKPGRPIVLTARDGTRLALPTDTSIRFSVFLQRLNGIARHSQTVVITAVLIEKIILATKVDQSHARALRNIVGVPPQEIQEVEPEEEGEEEDMGDAETIDVGPIIVTKEAVYRNSAAIKRTWSDGHEDYECSLCGHGFPTVQSCNGHYSGHVRRGETSVPPARRMSDIRRKQLAKLERDKERRHAKAIAAGREPGKRGRPPKRQQAGPLTEAEWKGFSEATGIEKPAEKLSTARIAEMVEKLIDEAVAEATAEMAKLLDAARQEIDRLVAERSALRDLLS